MTYVPVLFVVKVNGSPLAEVKFEDDDRAGLYTVVPLIMWFPMTAASTLMFGREEMVDAAACRAASLGANKVNPLDPASAAANVMLAPPVLLEEELEVDTWDRILLSIVRFCMARTVSMGPGGVRTPLIM